MSEKIATEFFQCDFGEFGTHHIMVDLYEDSSIQVHNPSCLPSSIAEYMREKHGFKKCPHCGLHNTSLQNAVHTCHNPYCEKTFEV
jgi:hypothetical protein